MCRVEVELNFGITLCHFSDGAEKMKKKKYIYIKKIYMFLNYNLYPLLNLDFC